MSNEFKVKNANPISGQFIAVWKYKGNIWSDTFKYDKHGNLLKYAEFGEYGEFNESDELWVEVDILMQAPFCLKERSLIKYITLKEKNL